MKKITETKGVFSRAPGGTAHDSRAVHARIQLKATIDRAQCCCKPNTQLVAWSDTAHTPAQQAGHARIQFSTPGDTQEYRLSSPVSSPVHAKICPNILLTCSGCVPVVLHNRTAAIDQRWSFIVCPIASCWNIFQFLCWRIVIISYRMHHLNTRQWRGG
jgi:hypothetical protein